MIGCKGDGWLNSTGMGERKLHKQESTMTIEGLRGEVLEAHCRSANLDKLEEPDPGREWHIQ
jgi:hypothetical protein